MVTVHLSLRLLETQANWHTWVGADENPQTSTLFSGICWSYLLPWTWWSSWALVPALQIQERIRMSVYLPQCILNIICFLQDLRPTLLRTSRDCTRPFLTDKVLLPPRPGSQEPYEIYCYWFKYISNNHSISLLIYDCLWLWFIRR